MLTALGQASTRLRAKLGESMGSIQAYDAPIERATTSSLEALKAFTTAEELRGTKGELEAIPFLQKAIELDPNRSSGRPWSSGVGPTRATAWRSTTCRASTASWASASGPSRRPARRFSSPRTTDTPTAYYVLYVRGLAHLRARAGAAAAAQFQRILDHRGLDPLSPLYPLSQLGLARAKALAGDAVQSRRAYQDFLALWKDADASIPVLRKARAEYAKLPD